MDQRRGTGTPDKSTGASSLVTGFPSHARSLDGPRIEFHSAVGFDRLPSILENALYRIAQEALSNARRHSRSENVKVSLVEEGEQLRLEVQDWGIGFSPEAIGEERFASSSPRQNPWRRTSRRNKAGFSKARPLRLNGCFPFEFSRVAPRNISDRLVDLPVSLDCGLHPW
ncbi:MAG: hypothetical protein GXY83_11050 [Rhodopirellula sp.]|nr:hypothetical protein [Rhodopirellula sp.]